MKVTTQEARDTNNINQRIESILDSLKNKRQIALIIEICSLCNLNCEFCNLHSPKTVNLDDQKGIMDEELYYKIINDAADLGYKFKAVHFHGWGEPLIQKKIPQMVKYAVDKDIAERYILISNGVLLDEKMFESLVKSGLSEIRISLDTIKPEKYLKIKGKDCVKTVLTNIDNAINVIASQDKMKLFIKIPGTNSNSIFGVTNEDTQEVIDYYKNVDSPNVNIILQPLVVTIGAKVTDNKPCEQVFYTSLIRFDGRVSACCVDLYDNLKIGDVKEQTLSEIFEGNELKKIRKIHAEGKLEELPQCLHCGFRTPVDLSNYKDKIIKYINMKDK